MTANDNGKLEFLEFCEIIAKNKKTLEEEQEELRNAFRKFDHDGNGHVDREELKKVNTRFYINQSINQSIYFIEKYHINKTIQNIVYQVDKTYKAHEEHLTVALIIKN